MKIGFDIDGVILEMDVAMLRAADLNEDKRIKDELNKYYYLTRKIQLNPIDFLAEGDELYLITGRDRRYLDLTMKWKNKYFPNAKLILLGHVEPGNETIIEDWFIKQARLKASVLLQEEIDVYFEDTPEVVRELRKLCPEVVIIQYGGREFDREII